MSAPSDRAAMRNWLTAFALLMAIGSLCGMRSQDSAPASGGKTGKVEHPGTTPDISGVWRRSRRPPDNKRKYTLYEIALSLTNEEPPMTPWGLEKFKTPKPNVGPHGVTLAKTNDPVAQCFPPGVPKIYLVRGAPLEILESPGRVMMYFEYDHFVREIFTDGRPH